MKTQLQQICIFQKNYVKLIALQSRSIVKLQGIFSKVNNFADSMKSDEGRCKISWIIIQLKLYLFL